MQKKFDPNEQVLILIGILTKEAKADIETHPVIAEAKISYGSVQLKAIQIHLCFLLIKLFCFASSVK